MVDKELELGLKLVNDIFGEDYTLENVEENVSICISIWGVEEEEHEKIFRACYDEFGDDKVSGIEIFKSEISDDYIVLTDDDKIEEMFKTNEDGWIGTYSYFVIDLDDKITKLYYSQDTISYLDKYKYVLHLDRYN